MISFGVFYVVIQNKFFCRFKKFYIFGIMIDKSIDIYQYYLASYHVCDNCKRRFVQNFYLSLMELDGGVIFFFNFMISH